MAISETDVDKVFQTRLVVPRPKLLPKVLFQKLKMIKESIIDNVNETVIDPKTTDCTIMTIASKIDAQLVTMAVLTPLANEILVALHSVVIAPSRVMSSEQRNLMISSFLNIAWPAYESQRDFMPPIGRYSCQNLAIANCAKPAPQV